MPSKVIPSGYEFIKFEVKERARVFKGEIKRKGQVVDAVSKSRRPASLSRDRNSGA